MTRHLADRANSNPDHRSPSDLPFPALAELVPLEHDDDGWFDDCSCGWSFGHRDLCVCGSVAAEVAGQAEPADDRGPLELDDLTWTAP